MQDPKLIYEGKVKDGKIEMPRRVRQEVCQTFEGRQIEVTFRRKRKRRSNEQNRYYWGVVIPEVIKGLIDVGNDDFQLGNTVHAEQVHEFLKAEILQNGEEIILAGGEMKRLPATTTTLTTTEHMEFIDKVRAWAGEFLGINIPEPNEQVEIF